MFAATVAFSGGTYCFYTAGAFAYDWMDAMGSREGSSAEVQVSPMEGLSSLFHAVFAGTVGVGLMVVTTQVMGSLAG